MSGASAASGTALLERGEGLRAIERSLREVGASGEGRRLLVMGEAGVGKTALLRRFSRTQEGSTRVLWGSCEPLVTARPLGPLFDVGVTAGGELQELVTTGARPHEVTAALLSELDRKPHSRERSGCPSLLEGS